MKTIQLIITACFVSVLLASCAGMRYGGIPRADRHRGAETADLETPSTKQQFHEAEVRDERFASASDQPELISIPSEVITHVEPVDLTQEVLSLAPINDDTVTISNNETQRKQKEEERSEELAKKARNMALLPLSLIVPGIGFFSFLVGLIGTMVCISRINQLRFVTQFAMEEKERAIKTLIQTTLGTLLFVVAIGVVFALIL